LDLLRAGCTDAVVFQTPLADCVLPEGHSCRFTILAS
jgi:hypothetical protein